LSSVLQCNKLYQMDLKGILYVVATPIGNLKDITFRAVEIFREVDFVVAENNLRALKLLNHFEIRKPIISINSYNEARKAQGIVAQMLKGKQCALITGAGTPCISDPGNTLIKKCLEEGIEVKPIPGPSAAVSAVSVSGLFADHFLFYGFLPQKRGKQKRILLELVEFPYASIFYESPRRLKATLKNIQEVFGNRQTIVVKEMTKIHENIYRGRIEEILENFPEHEIKGEFTIVVEGKDKNAM